MKVLSTIEEVHKIFDTAGSSPLLVTCDDFNDWVCKYDRFPKYLFNELFASEFAKLWNINTPKTALINVKTEHILLINFLNYSLLFLRKNVLVLYILKIQKRLICLLFLYLEKKVFVIRFRVNLIF